MGEPGASDRKLIIGAPPTPKSRSASARQRFSSFSKLRWPLLMVLGLAVAGAILLLFLGDIEKWSDVVRRFDRNSATDAIGPTAVGRTDVAAGVPTPDFTVRTIALPALENDGALPVYFRLPAPAGWSIDVTYRTEPHTAEANKDFTPRSGTVTIPPGETLVELEIPLIDDDIAETAELFWVILTVDPETASVTDSVLTATVLDDDYNKKESSR